MRRRRFILATLIFSAALAAFTWIAATVGTGGALAPMDTRIDSWLHVHTVPSITEVMTVISFPGAPSTLTVVSAASCLLLRQRSHDRLVDLVTLMLGGNLLNYGLKLLIHRGRPTSQDPLLTLSSYSFPSGHAMASTVFYGFVMACVLTMKPSRHITVIAAGIVMIGLVCMSRVYLGVHYLSDVLAGILEAITWSTLVLTGLHIARAYRRSAESQRLPE